MLTDKKVLVHGVGAGKVAFEATMVAGKSSSTGFVGYASSRLSVAYGSCTDNRIDMLYDTLGSEKNDPYMYFLLFPVNNIGFYAYEASLSIDGNPVSGKKRYVRFSSNPENVLGDQYYAFDEGPNYVYKIVFDSSGNTRGFDCQKVEWPNIISEQMLEWLYSDQDSEGGVKSFRCSKEYFSGEKTFNILAPPDDGRFVFPKFGFVNGRSYKVSVEYEMMWMGSPAAVKEMCVKGGGKHLVFRAANRSLFKEAA